MLNMENVIPIAEKDLEDLFSKNAELLVVGANVNGHPGKVYEVIDRSLDKITAFYLGDLYESTFRRGGCGCGGEDNVEGDYLIETGRISFHPQFALGGQATKYDLKSNKTSGDTRDIFLYFDKTPTEKVQMSLK